MGNYLERKRRGLIIWGLIWAIFSLRSILGILHSGNEEIAFFKQHTQTVSEKRKERKPELIIIRNQHENKEISTKTANFQMSEIHKEIFQELEFSEEEKSFYLEGLHFLEIRIALHNTNPMLILIGLLLRFEVWKYNRQSSPQ